MHGVLQAKGRFVDNGIDLSIWSRATLHVCGRPQNRGVAMADKQHT